MPMSDEEIRKAVTQYENGLVRRQAQKEALTKQRDEIQANLVNNYGPDWEAKYSEALATLENWEKANDNSRAV